MYYNATAVLKIDSLYKEGKNYHPQVYFKECEYTDGEKRQRNMLNNAVTYLRVTQLIINEQGVAVSTCQKVKYTLLKLYEYKGRA